MNIDKAIALLPQVMTLTADERSLLRAAMDTPLTDDLAKFSSVVNEVKSVCDFLAKIAGWTIPA